jgi:hypothetical protein
VSEVGQEIHDFLEAFLVGLRQGRPLEELCRVTTLPLREAVCRLPAGRELDSLVHSRVQGYPLLGWAPCKRDPEDGSLRVSRYGHGDLHPVHLDHCCCDGEPEDDPLNRMIFGHNAACLEPAPEYSTDMATVWPLAERRLLGVWPDRERGGWLVSPESAFSSCFQPVHGETAPLAISRCLLLLALKGVKP